MSYTNQVIDDLLQPFNAVIREDLEKYRNHVLRVYQNCLLLDSNKDNDFKYAIAAVYLDIGIWTNQTIDYLEPSIEQAKIFLTQTDSEEWIEEISLMIYWHHKLSRYEGRYAETVENFRKADWIDVSIGVLTFGANKMEIEKNRKAYPNRGFHVFLIKKITGNLFKHPFNPLPLFTR
jgi:hypothetical protein